MKMTLQMTCSADQEIESINLEQFCKTNIIFSLRYTVEYACINIKLQSRDGNVTDNSHIHNADVEFYNLTF